MIRDDTLPGIYTFTVSLDNYPCLDETKDPPLNTKGYSLYKSSYSCGIYDQDTKDSTLLDQ